jgi:uncharacterized membrane protein
MGFWNKVKQGITQMTGGGGNMQIVLQNPQVKKGESLNVTITLTATAVLSGKSVNLEVNSVETVKFQVPVVSTTPGSSTQASLSSTTQYNNETKDNQLYHGAVAVDGAVSMQPGETKTYTVSIPIPANVQPTFAGTDAKHSWFAHAYLDVPMGADIDARADFTVA